MNPREMLTRLRYWLIRILARGDVIVLNTTVPVPNARIGISIQGHGARAYLHSVRIHGYFEEGGVKQEIGEVAEWAHTSTR